MKKLEECVKKFSRSLNNLRKSLHKIFPKEQSKIFTETFDALEQVLIELVKDQKK